MKWDREVDSYYPRDKYRDVMEYFGGRYTFQDSFVLKVTGSLFVCLCVPKDLEMFLTYNGAVSSSLILGRFIVYFLGESVPPTCQKNSLLPTPTFFFFLYINQKLLSNSSPIKLHIKLRKDNKHR